MVITFLIITTLSFFLMHTLPGTPFNDEKLSDTQKARLNEKYGLDQPVVVQYVRYLANIARGDFGISYQFDGQPVSKVIRDRVGPTIQLGLQSLVFGTIVGLALGLLAAVKRHSLIDQGAMVIAVLGVSIPSFVFAGFLQYWVGVRLQWLPIAFWGRFEHTILPSLALSVGVIATVARYVRMEMLDVMTQDYMATAKAKGLGTLTIIVKHGLRNALIPVITIMGPLVVGLLTGSLVIEQIFSVPGIGEQFTKSVMTNDYPVIMATTLFFAVLFIGIIFIVDLLYGVIDPRIRLAGRDQS
jgi:oligopeptide transport system permease protein